MSKVVFEEASSISVEHEVEIEKITGKHNPDGSVLCSREYQAAPAYTRLNCLIEADCNVCRISHNFGTSIDLPTNSLALRQIEHCEGGTQKIEYAGITKGEIRKHIGNIHEVERFICVCCRISISPISWMKS